MCGLPVIACDGDADIRRDRHPFHVFNLADDVLGYGYCVDAALFGNGHGHSRGFVKRPARGVRRGITGAETEPGIVRRFGRPVDDLRHLPQIDRSLIAHADDQAFQRLRATE